MENTRTTNEQGLPTVSEESSQVGGHLPQAEESFQVEEGHLPQAERRRAHKNKLSYMFVNLLSLTEFFIAVGATLWNFWCRGFKPLWHWVEVFVEELYLSVIGTVAIVVYQETSHVWITSPILAFCTVKLITRYRRARQLAQADNNTSNQQNHSFYLTFVWVMNVVLTIVSAVYQIELAIVGRHEVNMQACIFKLNRCYTPDKHIDLLFWGRKSLFSYIDMADKPSNVTVKIAFTGDTVVPANFSAEVWAKCSDGKFMESLAEVTHTGTGDFVWPHVDCGLEKPLLGILTVQGPP
ncbi:hypothetical protein C366_04279 [Cryptococcus neoformans Tu401-1]|nr:hypothetical protein C366_04279 [Cryptococcus neoformans var. grubii Tu401-1]OXM78324.1 hypothetical protein C364_04263 [Cryptococcus neoformans var. grubii Bt63]